MGLRWAVWLFFVTSLRASLRSTGRHRAFLTIPGEGHQSSRFPLSARPRKLECRKWSFRSTSTTPSVILLRTDSRKMFDRSGAIWFDSLLTDGVCAMPDWGLKIEPDKERGSCRVRNPKSPTPQLPTRRSPTRFVQSITHAVHRFDSAPGLTQVALQ